MKSQRHHYDEASRRIAEKDETFLILNPTPEELDVLIAKRPAVWGRYYKFSRAYLNSQNGGAL